MSPGLCAWDEGKVQQVFSKVDAKCILNCSIAKEEVSQTDLPLWKVIARLPVLPKIRIFGWRLGPNALPVGQKMWVAQLSDGQCKLCDKDTETLLHAVRKCQTVQEVFRVTRMDVVLPQGPYVTCRE
ncbi:hypothetical protein V6N13_028306 [Hibiscus sabdariffa]